MYQHQLNYYTTIGNNKCSITNYEDKLVTLIEEWINTGDQVVLMIDEKEIPHKNKKAASNARWNKLD